MSNLFLARLNIAGRVPGTDAGCGLSTRGFGLVPQYVMKANGVEGTLQDGVQHIHCIISIM
jgi:hypothetical protein